MGAKRPKNRMALHGSRTSVREAVHGGLQDVSFVVRPPAAQCQSRICIRTTAGLSLLLGLGAVPVEVVGCNTVRTPAGKMVEPLVGTAVGNPVVRIVAGMAASRASVGHVVARKARSRAAV